jgi:ATP-dependent DNA ligase
LFDAVCEQELEGVVAKRPNEPYAPAHAAAADVSPLLG